MSGWEVDTSKEAWTRRAKAACEWRGLAQPEAASWIGELVRDNDSEGARDGGRVIRCHGGEMTAEDVAGLGLRKGIRIGWIYWHALTDKGRLDPIGSSELLYCGTMFRFYRERDWAGFLRLRVEEVQFIATRDNRTCRVGFDAHGRTFPLGQAMTIPLPECDAEHCLCFYMTYKDRRGRVRDRAHYD
ncbi:MAG: hypothetical protein U1E45_14825 [Geminicoccaceae bacterium]